MLFGGAQIGDVKMRQKPRTCPGAPGVAAERRLVSVACEGPACSAGFVCKLEDVHEWDVGASRALWLEREKALEEDMLSKCCGF